MAKDLNGVTVSRIHVKLEDTDVSVDVVLKEESPHAVSTQWPAAWSDDQLDGEEFGFGETIDEDELKRRQTDARGKAARKVAKALYTEE